MVIKKEKADLNQVSPTRIQEIAEAANMDATTEIKEKKKNTKAPREDQVNMKLPAEIKLKWRKFFLDNNLNLTQGVVFAVENLIQEVEDGEATLSMGGVYKKK